MGCKSKIVHEPQAENSWSKFLMEQQSGPFSDSNLPNGQACSHVGIQPELVRGVSRAQALACIIPAGRAKIPGHTKGY